MGKMNVTAFETVCIIYSHHSFTFPEAKKKIDQLLAIYDWTYEIFIQPLFTVCFSATPTPRLFRHPISFFLRVKFFPPFNLLFFLFFQYQPPQVTPTCVAFIAHHPYHLFVMTIDSSCQSRFDIFRPFLV